MNERFCCRAPEVNGTTADRLLCSIVFFPLDEMRALDLPGAELSYD